MGSYADQIRVMTNMWYGENTMKMSAFKTNINKLSQVFMEFKSTVEI